MALGFWDIDRLTKEAETPGQAAARKWLEQNPEKEMRAVQSGDLDRLTGQHGWDPADQFMGVSTGGGGIDYGTGAHYPGGGYNAPNRRYPGEYPEGSSSETHSDPNYEYSDNGAARQRADEENFYFDGDDDEDNENNGEDYHIVTRPRNAIHGLNVLDEHNYHPFGRHYMGTGHSAMEMFAEDHPEYDDERYPDTAEHEIIGAHLAEDHDRWHRDLQDEDETFNNRILPHGLQRESPEVPGHRAYRYVEPNGVTHRIWHNQYTSGGPSWQTSRYDPRLPHEQQPTMWTAHSDSTFEDPLGEALGQFERNRQVR